MNECAVIAHGLAQATLEDIGRLRKDPGPGRPAALDHQIMKYADEHTVLALAAMLDGRTRLPADTDCSSWGVVAAPRWPGRLGIAGALEKFHDVGARGVSALLIPTLCLHSLSGTISLVFGMHGPNFGVGGGLAAVADGLVSAIMVQCEQRPPGVWLIFTEWNVEPGQIGAAVTPKLTALMLALAPADHPSALGQLRLHPTDIVPMEPACPRLTELVDHVTSGTDQPWSVRLDWGVEVTVRWATAGSRKLQSAA